MSTQEFADAIVAIDLLGEAALRSPQALKAVLSTTLAKDDESAEILANLFDLHFLAQGTTSSADLEAALRTRGLSAEDAENTAAALRDALVGDEELAALARAILDADAWTVEMALENAARHVDLSRMQTELQVGYFSQQIMSRLGLDDVERMLKNAAGGVGSAMGEGGAMLLRGLVDERLLALRRDARTLTAREQRKRNFERERILTADLAIDRAFGRLLQDDVLRMRPEVERLAARLISRTKARDKRARRGRIDLAKTLRKNIAHDSIPIVRQHKRKRRERPDLVILCDISDSVRAASLFMLELVSAIGELFRHVRSFVFVDDIAESTDLFHDSSVDVAIEAILGGALVAPYASSDYGAVLRKFAAEFLDGLTRKTTVVILGDGRCNQRDSEAWVVEEMRRRAKSVLWFCPEERRTWGLGDSEMPAFERACTEVHVVRNLRQLGQAVDHVGL